MDDTPEGHNWNIFAPIAKLESLDEIDQVSWLVTLNCNEILNWFSCLYFPGQQTLHRSGEASITLTVEWREDVSLPDDDDNDAGRPTTEIQKL